jgi:heme/copper-type cytochrome/quinol oxidase subunit 2
MRITMLGVCALLAAGVFVAMFHSICRSQGRTDDGPCGRRGLAIELLWASIPCLMIITALIPAAIRILVAESAK